MLTVPGYTADGWQVRIFAASDFLDPDKPIRQYTKRERHDVLHKEPTKVRVERMNLTLAGAVVASQSKLHRCCRAAVPAGLVLVDGDRI